MVLSRPLPAHQILTVVNEFPSKKPPLPPQMNNEQQKDYADYQQTKAFSSVERPPPPSYVSN